MKCVAGGALRMVRAAAAAGGRLPGVVGVGVAPREEVEVCPDLLERGVGGACRTLRGCLSLSLSFSGCFFGGIVC